MVDGDDKSAGCNPDTAIGEAVVDVWLAGTWKNKYLGRKLCWTMINILSMLMHAKCQQYKISHCTDASYI